MLRWRFYRSVLSSVASVADIPYYRVVFAFHWRCYWSCIIQMSTQWIINQLYYHSALVIYIRTWASQVQPTRSTSYWSEGSLVTRETPSLGKEDVHCSRSCYVAIRNIAPWSHLFDLVAEQIIFSYLTHQPRLERKSLRDACLPVYSNGGDA